MQDWRWKSFIPYLFFLGNPARIHLFRLLCGFRTAHIRWVL